MLQKNQVRNDATRLLHGKNPETLDDIVELVMVNRAYYSGEGELPKTVDATKYDPSRVKTEAQHRHDGIVNSTTISLIQHYESVDRARGGPTGTKAAQESKSKGGTNPNQSEEGWQASTSIIMQNVTKFFGKLLHNVFVYVRTSAFLFEATATASQVFSKGGSLQSMASVKLVMMFAGQVPFSGGPIDINFDDETKRALMTTSNTLKTTSGVISFVRGGQTLFLDSMAGSIQKSFALLAVAHKLVWGEWIYNDQHFPETKMEAVTFLAELSLNSATNVITARTMKDMFLQRYGSYIKAQTLAIAPPPKPPPQSVKVVDDAPEFADGTPGFELGGKTLKGEDRSKVITDIVDQERGNFEPMQGPSEIRPQDRVGPNTEKFLWNQARARAMATKAQVFQSGLSDGPNPDIGKPQATSEFIQWKQGRAQAVEVKTQAFQKIVEQQRISTRVFETDDDKAFKIWSLKQRTKTMDKVLDFAKEAGFDIDPAHNLRARTSVLGKSNLLFKGSSGIGGGGGGGGTGSSTQLLTKQVVSEEIPRTTSLLGKSRLVKDLTMKSWFESFADNMATLSNFKFEHFDTPFQSLAASISSAINSDSERYQTKTHSASYSIEPHVHSGEPIGVPVITVIQEARQKYLDQFKPLLRIAAAQPVVEDEAAKSTVGEAETPQPEPTPKQQKNVAEPREKDPLEKDPTLVETIFKEFEPIFKVPGKEDAFTTEELGEDLEEIFDNLKNLGSVIASDTYEYLVAPMTKVENYIHFLDNVVKPAYSATRDYALVPLSDAIYYTADWLMTPNELTDDQIDDELAYILADNHQAFYEGLYEVYKMTLMEPPKVAEWIQPMDTSEAPKEGSFLNLDETTPLGPDFYDAVPEPIGPFMEPRSEPIKFGLGAIGPFMEYRQHQDVGAIGPFMPHQDIGAIGPFMPHQDIGAIGPFMPHQDIGAIGPFMPHQDVGSIGPFLPYEPVPAPIGPFLQTQTAAPTVAPTDRGVDDEDTPTPTVAPIKPAKRTVDQLYASDTSVQREVDRAKDARSNLRPYLANAGTDAFEEQENDWLKVQNLMMGQTPHRPIGTPANNPLAFGQMVQEGVRYSGKLDETPVYYKGGSLTDGDTLYGTVRDSMPTPKGRVSKRHKVFQ